jgi:predicted dehydrogenase
LAAAAGTARAPGRVIGANDRINVAVIGVGGMGSGHVGHIKSLEEQQNVKLVAVCDVYANHRYKAAANAGIDKAGVYKDYRKLLERKDIDEVVIATPDHWHGKIACDAMQAGKHVYVEKPMTRYLDEAMKMWDTAKSTKKIVQIGSQGCTDVRWHQAGQVVKDGKAGKLLWAQGSYCRNNPNGEWNYHIEPEANEQSVDWKMWLGSAPKIPYNPERQFRWRKYWDYGTGIIGDLWPHRLHPLMIAMNLTEFPKRVACIGSDMMKTDQGYGAPRDVADATMMMVEFPSGPMIYLAGSTVNEQGLQDVLRFSKATMYIDDAFTVKPERPFVDELEEWSEPRKGPGESQVEHHKNLFDCIRNNKKPNCPIELGVRVQAMVSMAEKSYRENKMMMFDESKMKMYAG